MTNPRKAQDSKHGPRKWTHYIDWGDVPLLGRTIEQVQSWILTHKGVEISRDNIIVHMKQANPRFRAPRSDVRDTKIHINESKRSGDWIATFRMNGDSIRVRGPTRGAARAAAEAKIAGMKTEAK